MRSLTFRLQGFHGCTYMAKEETGDRSIAQLLSGTVCQSLKFLSSKFTSSAGLQGQEKFGVLEKMCHLRKGVLLWNLLSLCSNPNCMAG